ncbi:MAG: beta strand repeat-containing protein, partial [Planctomycetia bacterium]
MRARSIPSRLSTLFGRRTARAGRTATAARRNRRSAITSAESLESRHLLAFDYLGITHTAVPTIPTTQAYQYNFEVYNSSPSDAAAMNLRYIAQNINQALQFDYTTSFNSLTHLGANTTFSVPGVGNGLLLPPVNNPNVVATGPLSLSALPATSPVVASWNTTAPTTENFYLSKIYVRARPGTVNPSFTLHVGDSMPLALEIDFSQATGTSTITINSSAAEAYNAASPAGSLPNAGAGYTLAGSVIRIQAALTPRFSNDYRAANLIRIENAITGGLNARVSNGNFELIAGASVTGATNVVTGGGVPGNVTTTFGAYGFGGNGGDILIDGAINSGSSVILQTFSVDPRIIRTGATGSIQGTTSITLNNAGADGGVIDVTTRNFAQHNIFAGSVSNRAADIGIRVQQTAGDLTLNALPASRGKIDLSATAADGDVIINSNVDTIGALALSAPTLNISRPLSTQQGDITLTGGNVTLGSNVTAGQAGIGDLVITATAGAVNVTSAAIVQAPGDAIRIGATGGITSQATLTADVLALTAGGAIDVNTLTGAITAQAGGAITIDEVDALLATSIATTAAGNVAVTAGGALDLVSVTTAGTGDIIAATTAGGLIARDLSTQNGNIVLTASSGDIQAQGDVFANGTGKDFTLSATTGNIVMSPSSTFTVADQLVFQAPTGRVLTPGTISSVSVTTAGSGYTSAPSVSFESGSGASVTPIVGSTQVTFIRVTQGGSGYVSAPAVVFDNAGTGGAGAAASAVLQNGSVVGVSITSGGTNYTSAPSISFVGGGGSGAVAEASINGLTSINTTSAGTGYQVPPTVVISSGQGASTAAIKVDAAGSILGVNLTQPGTSYNAAPTVVITDASGSGFGATATATLTNGVTGGIVTAGGSGYSATTTVSVSGTGTGATALPLLGLTTASIGTATAGTNYRSGDLLTVLAGTGARVAVTGVGPVTSIAVGSQGSGYTTATVSITGGGGSGATATATIGGSGQITAITITNPGTGYTSNPTVNITGDGTGAAATAVASPTGVSTLQVLDGGRDYSVGDVLYLNDLSLGATGFQATVTAVSAGGTITGLSPSAGGTGYTTAMRLGHVGGTGGVLQVNFGLAAIGTALTVTNPGAGYTSTPTVT